MKKIILWGAILLVLGMGARNLWMGKAPDTAQREQPDQVEQEEQIVEEFVLEGFDEEGNQVWKLTGESAHIQDSGDVFIERNVVLELEEATKVYANKVYWQNARSRFFTNQPVKVRHKEVEIDGIGALGKMDEKFVQINQDVRMVIRSGSIVTCRGPMRVYQEEDRIALYRNVWILDERGAVSSDKMDAIFDKESRKIMVVIADGHVRISRGEDVTFADRAIYDAKHGSVKLEGAPEISIRDVNAYQSGGVSTKKRF